MLTADELQVLADKHFASERVTLVRDLFLFSCFTGLAYADVAKLKCTEIRIGIDGEKWVFTKRTNTDTSSRIPLLQTSLAILKKYENHPKCYNTGLLLPVISNQKMNAYLKEIADICNIDKKTYLPYCTTHICYDYYLRQWRTVVNCQGKVD